MTPQEKHIIITHAVAKEHKKLVSTDVWKCRFIATATWMLVLHLRKDGEGNFYGLATIQEESEVKLQHLPEYKYVKQCSRATVVAVVEATKLKEEAARVELEHTEAKEKEAIEVDCAVNAPFLAKVNDFMDKLVEVLATLLTGDLEKMH